MELHTYLITTHEREHVTNGVVGVLYAAFSCYLNVLFVQRAR